MTTDDDKFAEIDQIDAPKPDTLTDLRVRAELALSECQMKIAELRHERDRINEMLRPLVKEEPLLASTVRHLTPKDER